MGRSDRKAKGIGVKKLRARMLAPMRATARHDLRQSRAVAISVEDAQKWGCPHCGFHCRIRDAEGLHSSSCRCSACGKGFEVLGNGIKKSGIAYVFRDGDRVYPTLRPHPRQGIPSHDLEDVRPEGGGEFFSSRGIGYDSFPACFVCGAQNDGDHAHGDNIAAFVRSRQAGERVVQMFGGRARLDYREWEPAWIQVKLGSCKKHLPCLEMLDSLTHANNRIITQEIIAQATSFEPKTTEVQLPG